MGLSSYSILTREYRGGGPDHQRVGTAWSKGVARPEILVSGTSDRGFKSHPPHQHRKVRPYLVRNGKGQNGVELDSKDHCEHVHDSRRVWRVPQVSWV